MHTYTMHKHFAVCNLFFSWDDYEKQQPGMGIIKEYFKGNTTSYSAAKKCKTMVNGYNQ